MFLNWREFSNSDFLIGTYIKAHSNLWHLMQITLIPGYLEKQKKITNHQKKKKQEGIDITNFGYHVCCYWISVDSAQEWSVMESVSVS